MKLDSEDDSVWKAKDIINSFKGIVRNESQARILMEEIKARSREKGIEICKIGVSHRLRWVRDLLIEWGYKDIPFITNSSVGTRRRIEKSREEKNYG